MTWAGAREWRYRLWEVREGGLRTWAREIWPYDVVLLMLGFKGRRGVKRIGCVAIRVGAVDQMEWFLGMGPGRWGWLVDCARF